MPIRLLGDAVLRRRAWHVAEQLGWAETYDAEYVALTQLQADAFVTLNAELARRVEGIEHADVDSEVREATLALERAIRAQRPFVLPPRLACIHDEPDLAVDDDSVLGHPNGSLGHAHSLASEGEPVGGHSSTLANASRPSPG